MPGLTPKDYPVIDTTLKFCDMYLHRRSGLIDIGLQTERDRIVYNWLSDLEATARMAETAVLVSNFRGGARDCDGCKFRDAAAAALAE